MPTTSLNGPSKIGPIVGQFREALLLPTQGIFNLTHHIAMVWEELAFDDAVSYTQRGNVLQHNLRFWQRLGFVPVSLKSHTQHLTQLSYLTTPEKERKREIEKKEEKKRERESKLKTPCWCSVHWPYRFEVLIKLYLACSDSLTRQHFSFHNVFIQPEQIKYFVSTEALVFQPFYNSNFYENGLWGCILCH